MADARKRKSRVGWTEVRTTAVKNLESMNDSDVEEPPDFDKIQTQIESITSETDTLESNASNSEMLFRNDQRRIVRFVDNEIFKKFSAEPSALNLIEETERLKDNSYSNEPPEKDITESTDALTESGDECIPTKEFDDDSDQFPKNDKKPMALDLQKIHENGYVSPMLSSYVEFTEVTSIWISPSSPLRLKVKDIMKSMQQVDWEMLRELYDMVKRASRIDSLILSEFSFKLVESAKGREEAAEFLAEIDDDPVNAAIQFGKAMLSMFHACVPESNGDEMDDSTISGARIPEEVRDYYSQMIDENNGTTCNESRKSWNGATKVSGNIPRNNKGDSYTVGKSKNPAYAHVKSRYMDCWKKATTEGKSKQGRHPILKPKKNGLTNASKKGEVLPSGGIYVPVPGSVASVDTAMDSATESSAFEDSSREKSQIEPQGTEPFASVITTTREVSQCSVSIQTSKLDVTEMESEWMETEPVNELEEPDSVEKFFLTYLMNDAKKRIPGASRKFSSTKVQVEREEDEVEEVLLPGELPYIDGGDTPPENQ